MLWSTVASVQSGRRTGRPAVLLIDVMSATTIGMRGKIDLQSFERLWAGDFVNKMPVCRGEGQNLLPLFSCVIDGN